MIKLITGPNMGGKSTYLRQTALIVLLAQIGSYVPASSARIGLVDQIYSRVGASDNLAKGQSTFMVEMEETAYILRQATEKSLLILDEIGRGTSTYDGVSLAWSILEHIHNELGARTLFATHYHELIEVVDDLTRAQNFSVAVEEDDNGKAVLLHQIRAGAVSKSYGVHVAEKAGLPNSIIQRAEDLLSDLENNHHHSEQRSHQTLTPQPSLFATDQKAEQVRELIDSIDVNNLTPLQALQKLNEIKTDLHGS
jgi:DNA mismatch repair protein MutS